MRYYLPPHVALKLLEAPSAYDLTKDELYELDREGFEFMARCAEPDGCEAKDSEFIDFCIEESLLTTDPCQPRRAPIEQAPSPSLRYLELQITRRCNLKCRHCYIGQAQGLDLSFGNTEKALQEFERMQGLRVLLTGGEPLLHPHFDAINQMLGALALRYILFTNGTLLDDRRLATLKAHEIQISLDGIGPSHEAIRGKGSYAPALDAIKRALGAGFDVSVSTMVHPGNLVDFDRMEKMLKDLGVRDWSVDIPCPEGRLAEHQEHSISPQEGGKYLRYGFGDGLHGGGGGYSCGRHLMSVMADGSAAKCAFYTKSPAGTIEQGLSKAWAAVEHIPLDQLQCDCEHIESCRGGCRYRATMLGGPLAKDLYRCAAYDIIETSS